MKAELRLLNIIMENEKVNQRGIAKEVGVSLGTINTMLRNLEEKKYLSIHKAANNAARYFLTEEGREYRNQCLYEYVLECAEVTTAARVNLKNMLLALASRDVRNFYLSEAEDEISRMVRLILMEISRKFTVEYFHEIPEEIPESSVILGWSKNNPYRQKKQYVHLIHNI